MPTRSIHFRQNYTANYVGSRFTNIYVGIFKHFLCQAKETSVEIYTSLIYTPDKPIHMASFNFLTLQQCSLSITCIHPKDCNVYSFLFIYGLLQQIFLNALSLCLSYVLQVSWMISLFPYFSTFVQDVIYAIFCRTLSP